MYFPLLELQLVCIWSLVITYVLTNSFCIESLKIKYLWISLQKIKYTHHFFLFPFLIFPLEYQEFFKQYPKFNICSSHVARRSFSVANEIDLANLTYFEKFQCSGQSSNFFIQCKHNRSFGGIVRPVMFLQKEKKQVSLETRQRKKRRCTTFASRDQRREKCTI